MKAWLAATLLLGACTRDLVLSPYGARAGVSRSDDGWLLERKHAHTGVDFRVDRNGGQALAAADGIVDSVDFSAEAGFDVMVAHPGSGYWTRYVHLSFVRVGRGEAVQRGQVVGDVGIFPYSAGVRHVHFELCRSLGCWAPGPMGSTEDPMPHMAGCFEPERSYGGFGLVLTYPVRC